MRSTCCVRASGTPSDDALDGRDLFLLGGHDALERGVARLVDSGLNRDHSRQRQLDPLKPSCLELALQLHAFAGDFDGHDDRRVRPAEQFGEQHAGLAEALVVTLKSGENQIEIFALDGGRERAGRGERIELVEFRIGDVDAAFGALGKRFLDGLLGALRTHRDRHDFAAVLFFQAQRFFERESVRLVGFKSDVGFANPRAVIGDRQGRVLRGNLLDADTDFHD